VFIVLAWPRVNAPCVTDISKASIPSSSYRLIVVI